MNQVRRGDVTSWVFSLISSDKIGLVLLHWLASLDFTIMSLGEIIWFG